jgi:hypothetical protein
MTPESITTFLTGYLHSLSEETRNEKKGTRYGFDQIILQLAQAENWFPLRLAFHRGAKGKEPKPKKEAEHGVDLKFLADDGRTLIVFVLKDEPLTYRNWEDEKFHSDLHRASEQDLTRPELRGVKTVRIILAYNKGEEEEGVEEFDTFVKSRGSRVGAKGKITFERWNLETLTALMRAKLLNSPAIVPERFFHSFSYLCWQVGDFSHGSQQWEEVLISDWKEFLNEVLAHPAQERNVRLIPVALLVLRAHGKAEPAFETGWIELLEHAVIALWRTTRTTKNKKVLRVVMDVWISMYLASLEEYYERNAGVLQAEHSLAIGNYGEFGEVVAGFYSYWHMARLGILALSFVELDTMVKPENVGKIRAAFHKVLGWLVGMMNANPATRRPLLDIHHIELFLVWRLLRSAGRTDEALSVFSDIHKRLLHRRIGNGGVRIIDQSNSWPNLFEYIATGEEPSEAFGRSSYLLQMLIEICTGGLGEDGQSLGKQMYRHLIEGVGDDGKSFEFKEQVELQSWAPPNDWAERLLEGPVDHLGVCITVNRYYGWNENDRSNFSSRVESFVAQTRKAHPFEQPRGIPATVLVLASILHRSPLPPEFWRTGLFRSPAEDKEAEIKTSKTRKASRKTSS